MLIELLPRLFRRTLTGVVIAVAVLYGATLLAAYTPLTEHTLRTEITVNAPAAVIWQILTNLDSYAAWNPFFQRASGTVAVGETLRLEAHLDSNTIIFTPTVLEVRENGHLRWLGRVLLPGIFDGEHSFTLTPLADGRVRFVQRETFRELLIPFFGAVLQDTEKEFHAFNRALGTTAEQRLE